MLACSTRGEFFMASPLMQSAFFRVWPHKRVPHLGVIIGLLYCFIRHNAPDQYVPSAYLPRERIITHFFCGERCDDGHVHERVQKICFCSQLASAALVSGKLYTEADFLYSFVNMAIVTSLTAEE